MKPFAQMATIGRLHNIHLNIYTDLISGYGGWLITQTLTRAPCNLPACVGHDHTSS